MCMFFLSVGSSMVCVDMIRTIFRQSWLIPFALSIAIGRWYWPIGRRVRSAVTQHAHLFDGVPDEYWGGFAGFEIGAADIIVGSMASDFHIDSGTDLHAIVDSKEIPVIYDYYGNCIWWNGSFWRESILYSYWSRLCWWSRFRTGQVYVGPCQHPGAPFGLSWKQFEPHVSNFALNSQKTELKRRQIFSHRVC